MSHPGNTVDSARAVEHPRGGPIKPIARPESQARHTVVHLLKPAERWDYLPGVPPDLRQAALSAGCTESLFNEQSRQVDCANPACREHVTERYRGMYAPLYMADLDSAARLGQWGHWCADARGSDAFVGEHGIFVVVAADQVDQYGAQFSVRTAYRVRPYGHAGQEPTASQFKKAALRKLQDKTTYNQHGHRSR